MQMLRLITFCYQRKIATIMKKIMRADYCMEHQESLFNWIASAAVRITMKHEWSAPCYLCYLILIKLYPLIYFIIWRHFYKILTLALKLHECSKHLLFYYLACILRFDSLRIWSSRDFGSPIWKPLFTNRWAHLLSLFFFSAFLYFLQAGIKCCLRFYQLQKMTLAFV